MKHVWLPSLGVWAQAHGGMTAENGGAEPSVGVTSSTKRREDSANAPSCSDRTGSLPYPGTRDGHYDDHNRFCSLDAIHRDVSDNGVRQGSDDGHHHSGRYECHRHIVDDVYPHRHRRRHHGSREPCDELHASCPICLSSITPCELAVLQWCMHRFCLPCIEKWSSMQRFCPICKQVFRGWYYNIQSLSEFDTKDLSIQSRSQFAIDHQAQGLRQRYQYPISRPRAFRRLPQRRTFRMASGGVDSATGGEGDERALQWRAHIYKKNLRAVPFALNSRVKVIEASVSDPERKARIERRLEPWIHRELQAIEGDLDHSLLVHLSLSLWLRFLSEREHVAESRSLRQQQQRVPQADFGDAEPIRQLQPFLEEKASTFWHELRCFAESPYSLRAYDSVTKYEEYRGDCPASTMSMEN